MNTVKFAKKILNIILLIESHFVSHGVEIQLKLHSMPMQGRYIFKIKLMPGTKVDDIFNRASDVGAALGLSLFQPFRDGTGIYLAISKNSLEDNELSVMLASPGFQKGNMQLPLAIGYDLKHEMVFADLAKMPHALYAGATNSGKSVGLECLLFCLLDALSPAEVNFLIFDIGAASMDTFSDIPYLSHPIVKDTETGIHVVAALALEMERRISLAGSELSKLPAIVCVMDEFVSFINGIRDGDLRQEVTDGINNLLRRGRKANIHMVLATQDPRQKTMQVDIGNITSRMAFKCARYQTSIAILNSGGAEKLPGRGAMLYVSSDKENPQYVQGAYVSPEQANEWIEQIKAKNFDLSNKFIIPEPNQSEITTYPEAASAHPVPLNKADRELAEIILWTFRQETVSANKISAEFHMGNRANEIIDKLEKMGLVSEKIANQPRRVLPKAVEDIPQEVVEFLTRSSVSLEKVADNFTKGMSETSDCQEV